MFLGLYTQRMTTNATTLRLSDIISRQTAPHFVGHDQLQPHSLFVSGLLLSIAQAGIISVCLRDNFVLIKPDARTIYSSFAAIFPAWNERTRIFLDYRVLIAILN